MGYRTPPRWKIEDMVNQYKKPAEVEKEHNKVTPDDIAWAVNWMIGILIIIVLCNIL